MTQFPGPYTEGSNEQWRRPKPGMEPPAERAAEVPPPVYSGPPPTVPAPSNWRPPTMVTIPAPRQLPPQDPSVIEGTERRALVATYGVGMIAGAVGLLVLIILCGRVIF